LGYDTEGCPSDLMWITLKTEVRSSSGMSVRNYEPTSYFITEDFKLYHDDYERLKSCTTLIT